MIVELNYSDDWLNALRQRLDEAQIADPKAALVTDHMGVEVKPFDSSVYHLDRDHFPLRVFYLGQWSSQEGPAPNLERAKSNDMASLSSVEDNLSPAARKASQQVTAELQFEDVWPGILLIKLRAVAGLVEDGDLRGLVATDTTGVEIDISQHDRIPDAARFPLKLHFRAQGATTRQNLEEALGGPDSQMSNISPFGEEDRVGRTSIHKEFRDHSTALQLESILTDVINNRMRDMGSTFSAGRRPCILVTDRIGVQVCIPGGIPERSRFPLKFHVDDSTSPGEDRRGGGGMSMSMSTTLRFQEFDRKSRSFFKRQLSKISRSGL